MQAYIDNGLDDGYDGVYNGHEAARDRGDQAVELRRLSGFACRISRGKVAYARSHGTHCCGICLLIEVIRVDGISGVLSSA